MTARDRFPAAKILVDFMRDFTLLQEQQLVAVRRMMVQTVDNVMTSVHQLSDASDIKKRQANEILAKKATQESDETFSSAVPDLSQDTLEDELRRTGSRFAKHLEAISTLDDAVKGILLQVVGVLSSDDVIGQRLQHIKSSLQEFNSGMSSFLEDPLHLQNQERIKKLRNEILTNVYLSYTSEAERMTFHRIFGHPKTQTPSKNAV